MELEVLVPAAARSIVEHPLAARLGGMEGTRIGLLSNLKANATSLLTRVGEELQQRFPRVELVHEVKTFGPTVAAPDDVLGRLGVCQAVILAIAD